jgi:hypothetical protein
MHLLVICRMTLSLIRSTPQNLFKIFGYYRLPRIKMKRKVHNRVPRIKNETYPVPRIKMKRRVHKRCDWHGSQLAGGSPAIAL